MQLATARDGRPWLCNVWYVMDAQDNIYWISRATRRHSEEIADNPYVAATFHKWFGEGLGQSGQALIVSGTAEIVSIDQVHESYQLYADRYPELLNFQSLEATKDGSGDHLFYKITPREIVWWDEVNFPDQSRQVVK